MSTCCERRYCRQFCIFFVRSEGASSSRSGSRSYDSYRDRADRRPYHRDRGAVPVETVHHLLADIHDMIGA